MDPAATSADIVPGGDDQERRGRSIKLAVGTAMVSKIITACVQLVAMPIAARTLGKAEFGLFATVSMTITMIVLMELGVGSALMQGISQAASRDDKADARRYFATALAMILTLAAASITVIACLIALVPLPRLFGDQYAGLEAALRPALWVGLAVYGIEFVLNLVYRVREAYMETNVNNVTGAVGNLCALFLIAFVVPFVPHVWFMVIAYFGANVLARIVNLILLLKGRPYLLPVFRDVDWGIFKVLLKDGLAFSVFGALTIMVEFNVCALMIGRMLGPLEVATYQVLIILATALNGIFLMFTVPTWAALVDAWTKRDQAWIMGAAKRLYVVIMATVVLAIGAMLLFGSWAIPMLYGDDFQVSLSLLMGFAVYLLANAWRRVNHTLVVGVGEVVRSAKFTFLEVALTILGAYLGLKFGGMPWMLAGMGASIFLVSGPALPWIFWGAVKARDWGR